MVTAGTSGIGQAIVVLFAAEGAHAAINYRKDIKDIEGSALLGINVQVLEDHHFVNVRHACTICLRPRP